MDPKSQYRTGCEHYEKKNYELAAIHFRQSAEAGHASAQYNLGHLYEHGLGVEKDFTLSLFWTSKAAHQGLKEGQRDMSSFYYHGNVVAVDHVQAVKWATLAANQGCEIARYNLGILYLKGQGVEKDECVAARHFMLAGEYPDAAQALNKLKSKEGFVEQLLIRLGSLMDKK